VETGALKNPNPTTWNFNSLAAKSIFAKNSQSEGFLLAKHTAHKHLHHDEPFSTPAAWF
jgi:hypothetical protein